MGYPARSAMPAITRLADLLIVAVGWPEAVTGDMVSPGTVVIDVGVNRVDDATRERGYRLVGDVAYDEVAEKASWITPVPGRVGPMTIAMLLQNTVTAARLQNEPTPLVLATVHLGDHVLTASRGGATLETTREEIIRAAWPFMRVAIHFPEDPRAAQGLYGAAQAVERTGRKDKAAQLLEECLGHRSLTAETRSLAEAALNRLKAMETSGG